MEMYAAFSLYVVDLVLVFHLLPASSKRDYIFYSKVHMRNLRMHGNLQSAAYRCYIFCVLLVYKNDDIILYTVLRYVCGWHKKILE